MAGRSGRALLLAVACAAVVAATSPLLAQDASFRRGDGNADGAVDLSDGITVLNFLFLGSTIPPCFDALDTDDTGQLDISDGISVFNFLFLGGVSPRSPFPDCGIDSSPDPLGCAEYGFCEPVEPECFGQEDLDAAIEENVPPETCIPPDQEFDVQGFSGVICPVATAAADCGGTGAPGCAATIMEARGTLALEAPGGARIDLFVEGIVADLTVQVGETDCVVDIPFTAIATVPLTVVERPGGVLELTAIGTLVMDRESTEVSLTATGGLICGLFQAAQGLFIEDTIGQIEDAADGLLDDLRVELVGVSLCAP